VAENIKMVHLKRQNVSNLKIGLKDLPEKNGKNRSAVASSKIRNLHGQNKSSPEIEAFKRREA
jgi:hypothetical protein